MIEWKGGSFGRKKRWKEDEEAGGKIGSVEEEEEEGTYGF